MRLEWRQGVSAFEWHAWPYRVRMVRGDWGWQYAAEVAEGTEWRQLGIRLSRHEAMVVCLEHADQQRVKGVG